MTPVGPREFRAGGPVKGPSIRRSVPLGLRFAHPGRYLLDLPANPDEASS